MGSTTKSGFTIVELLIVIVVIAILASISVVAYSGIQERANLSAGKAFDTSLRRNLHIETVAAFNFNEGSGTAANDLSENNNDATVSGSWVAGMEGGNAIQANNNGTGALISTPVYFGDGSFTLAAWVNSSDQDGGQSRIFGADYYSPGPGGYFWLNFGNGRPYIEARDSLNAWWGSGSTSTNISGKWTHIAAVVDRQAGRSYIYVNGKIEAKSGVVSSAGIFGDASALNRFRVGYQNSSSTLSLDGVIDDVYVYKSALNLAQIEHLYEDGLARIARR